MILRHPRTFEIHHAERVLSLGPAISFSDFETGLRLLVQLAKHPRGVLVVSFATLAEHAHSPRVVKRLRLSLERRFLVPLSRLDFVLLNPVPHAVAEAEKPLRPSVPAFLRGASEFCHSPLVVLLR